MKIIFYTNPARIGVDMLILDEQNGKKYLAKPMKIVFEEYEYSVDVEPTLRLPDMNAQEFMRAMAEALDEQGVKTDKDSKIAGTLDATKYHLEDLRSLLKLKKEKAEIILTKSPPRV
ncbi:MAG: hypothetical protein NUV80_00885 [Candidatus Berkelbacteria bacterium]|nr:hypothetical protein [Candidatus Berkelbacteria bacterium]